MQRTKLILGFLLIFGVAAFFHLWRLGVPDLIGEDEYLHTQVGKAAIRFLHGDMNAIVGVLQHQYPPLQPITSAVSVSVFGMNEWAIRLPGALAGIAACMLFYWWMTRALLWPWAVFAGFLFAVSGAVGNHRYALAGGWLSVWMIIVAWALWEFMEAGDQAAEDRACLWASLGVACGIMSMQDSLFWLPVLSVAYVAKRGGRLSVGACRSIAIAGVSLLAYLIGWYLIPALWFKYSGSADKLHTAMATLGAFRINDLVGTLRTAFGANLLIGSVFIFWFGLIGFRRGDKWVATLYGFYTVIWVNVLNYQNVRACHLIHILPFYIYMVVRGLSWVWTRVSDDTSAIIRAPARVVLVVFVTFALTGTACQTIANQLTDSFPAGFSHVFGEMDSSHPAQSRTFKRYGFKLAGDYLREHMLPGERLVCPLSGVFGGFYVGKAQAVSSEFDWDRLIRRGSCGKTRWWVGPPSQIPSRVPSQNMQVASVCVDGHTQIVILDLQGGVTNRVELGLSRDNVGNRRGF